MNLDAQLLFLLALCLSLSFFLSGMEAGVLALDPLRIRQEARSGRASARLLQQFLAEPEGFLWTVTVGNALANFLVVCLSVFLLDDALRAHPAWLYPVLGVLVFGFYAMADLLPKMLFRQFPNRLCLALARPFRLVHLVLAGVVQLIAWTANLLLKLTGGRRFRGRWFGNREEIRSFVQESTPLLTRAEQKMVQRVLDLQKVTLGAITKPLAQAVTVTDDTPIAEVFRRLQEEQLTRLPVRERASGRIVGILSLRTSLYVAEPDPKQTAGAYVQSALCLPESMPLEAALRRLRQRGQRMALVLDGQQREVGIITLEDILRFVFGDVSL